MVRHSSFACLWCGRRYGTDDPSAIEGWAQLCPDCVGRAGDNEFLRFRLRAALAERAAAAGRGSAPGGSAGAEFDPARAAPPPQSRAIIDWYLRRGPFAQGPVQDQAWQADLETASAWLADAPLSGRIVELGTDDGWWSPLLARKGELWVIDDDADALEATRSRLVGHGLRAHLHRRDRWSQLEVPADAIFTAFRLGRTPAGARSDLVALVRRCLRPGGTWAFVEAAPDPTTRPRPEREDAGGGDRQRRIEPEALPHALLRGELLRAGFDRIEVEQPGRLLVLGLAALAGSEPGRASGEAHGG